MKVTLKRCISDSACSEDANKTKHLLCYTFVVSKCAFQRLDQKLRDNLRDARNNLFAVESVRAGQLHSSRPLLVIADRLVKFCL